MSLTLLVQQQAARHPAPPGEPDHPPPPALPPFDAAYPTIRQATGWTCSAASLAWLLSASGHPITEAEVVARLRPNISPALGLHWGDGRDLAALIAAEGLAAARGPVAFDDVVALLDGRRGVIMGGHGWYHWTGIRGTDGDRLFLANPAGSWMGVAGTMSRREFQALGPFRAVWLVA